MHSVKFPFEDEGEQGGNVWKELHTPETFGLIGDFDDSCSQSDINGIEEIATLVFVSVVEVAVAYVYFLQPMIDDTVDSRLVFGTKSPIFGEVISDTVRNHAEGDVLFVFGIG